MGGVKGDKVVHGVFEPSTLIGDCSLLISTGLYVYSVEEKSLDPLQCTLSFLFDEFLSATH